MPRRYILNSAVVTAEGVYVYCRMTPVEVRQWLQHFGRTAISRVGYEQTAQHIAVLYGGGWKPELSRDRISMEPGDTALVVRLAYRVDDPARKGEPADPDWEYGHLICVPRGVALQVLQDLAVYLAERIGFEFGPPGAN